MRRLAPPIISLIVFAILFISSSSASIICSSTTPFSQAYLEGSIPSDEFTIATSCQNSGANPVTSTIASNNNFFSLVDSPITLAPNFSSTKGFVKIKLNQAMTQGAYSGFVILGDLTIPVTLNITKVQSNPNDISFPTSKTININQGATLNNKVTLILPSNYPKSINIVAIEFTEENNLVSLGDVETGIVNPGSSKDIPLIINAKDAANGQYPPITLKVRYDDGAIRELNSKITIIVKSNTNPLSVETFSTRPNCALSSNDIKLNSTHTLTCSGIVENLQVSPEYNEHLEGISVDTTSNIFTWTFKPIKLGDTLFRAVFTYKGAPIFSPFQSEIRVRTSTGIVGGTNLKLLFTPSLDIAKNGEVVAIQLLDNSSSSLIESPYIEINAIPLTNTSGRTFFYTFRADQNYSIRGASSSYSDIVQTIFLSSKPLKILINPLTGNSDTIFDIKTDVENVSLFLDDISISNPYLGQLVEGYHLIRASKEGYFPTEINMTVAQGLFASSSGEFKKGILQTFQLNKNVSWSVYHKKDLESEKTIYEEGIGTIVEFEPTKAGIYSIEADGKILRDNLTIEPSSLSLFGIKWYWYLIVIAIGLIIFFIFKKNSSSPTITGFGGNVNT